jgi:gamma-glutamylcyclotransferase (GGCT)/AIG2-like uncharacterized protein YtfP
MKQGLFVFGTLKRGFPAHAYMKDARFLCETHTAEPCWDMVAVAWDAQPGEFFPGVTANGAGFVRGELYEVSDTLLAALDRFEDAGTDYERRPVTLQNGAKAWMYVFINRDALPQKKEHPQIDYDAGARIYNWILAS